MQKFLKSLALLIAVSLIGLFGLLVLLVYPMTVFSHDNAAQVTKDILNSSEATIKTENKDLTGCLKQINSTLAFTNGLFFRTGKGAVINSFEISDDVCVSVKFDLVHNGERWVTQKIYR